MYYIYAVYCEYYKSYAQLCKLIKDRMLNLQCCTRLFMEKQGFCRFDEAKFKTFGDFKTKQRKKYNFLPTSITFN